MNMNFFKKTAAAVFIVAISFSGCKEDLEKDPVRVSGVSLNKSALTLTVGASETLKATVEPENASIKTVNWTSSNPAVVS